MIAKDFIIAEDFYTYTIIIIRQEKILRDHAPNRLIRWPPWGVSAMRWAWDETRQLRQRHRLGVHDKCPNGPPNDRSHVRNLRKEGTPGKLARILRRQQPG